MTKKISMAEAESKFLDAWADEDNLPDDMTEEEAKEAEEDYWNSVAEDRAFSAECRAVWGD
jgi:hypothetical protein